MRRRSYTLLEMTVAVGVLAVVSLFVVRLFALSANIQRKSWDLDAACFGAQTMMEAARAGDELAVLSDLWPGGVHRVSHETDTLVYEAYFDRDWRSVSVRDEKGFLFRMEVRVTQEPGTAQWRACAFSAYRLSGYLMEEPEALLYTLKSAFYVPDEVGL